jgi:hypothetical protein
MQLQVTKAHWAGLAISGTSLIAGIAGIIGWLTKNISVPMPSEICVAGLPPWAGGAVTTVLPILVSIGGVISLFAPSVSDRVNEKAGFAAAKRLSTVPPPTAPPSSNSNPPGTV